MFLTIPSMGTSEQVRVNIKELGIVREHHMPAHAVRFASPCELERVAEETARKEPRLREEAHFVKHEELHRRGQLSQSPLQAVKGGQYDG